MIASVNRWDWLGHGIYFWENSPSRAQEFATQSSLRRNSKIKKPAILGAVLDLGNCLDLLDYNNLQFLKKSYEALKKFDPQFEFTHNLMSPKEGSSELLLRNLDCSVVEMAHELTKAENLPPFDSVKAVFWEGNLLYPNAGFREKNHIQICIRNPNCIKDFFIPR